VLSELATQGVATGLYSSATVADRPLSQAPSSSVTALPAMLELLARCTPSGRASLGELLTAEAGTLRRGASIVLVAADFPDTTLAAVAQLRRRLSITLLWVASELGTPPPPGPADVRWEVPYHADWRACEVVELAD
jgi:hypothetical protein